MLSLLWSIPEAAWITAGRVAASTSVILLRFISGKVSSAVLLLLLASSAH